MYSIIKEAIKTILNKADAILAKKDEDPIKIAQKEISKLQKISQECALSLAEIKEVEIKIKREIKRCKKTVTTLDKKIVLYNKQAKNKKMSLAEAKKLTSEAFKKKQIAIEETNKYTKELKAYQKISFELDNKIQVLNRKISFYESELVTMKAMYKIAHSTKKLNKHLAQIGSESMKTTLDYMKCKITEEETLAQAYDEINNTEDDVDKEIKKAIKISKKKEKKN